jgi:protein phosphatase
MGTTVTLGFRLDNELYIGHVGDSRAYLVRKGKMRQLTEDHSLVAQLIKEKVITPEEARTHPDRSKILRCLGVSGETRIDSFNPEGNEHKLNIQYGDVLMFCSDGLCGYAPDDEILSCLNKKEDAKTLCQSLVNLANLKGGGDNISVIVVKTGTSAS